MTDTARIQAELNALLANPRIPTLPSAAIRVLEKVGSPDCTLDAVGDIIRQDPALCGLMLKTLNSALYSFSRAVTSVDKALVMLGLTRIRSLILTLYLPAIKSSCPPSPLLTEFWKGSVIGAIITRELSARSSRRDPESDLLAALMRDLGQLVLMQSPGGSYAAVLEAGRGKSHGAVAVIERETLGYSHAEVSAELLRRWRLPESMCRAVAWHHTPEQAEAADADTGARTRILHFASLTSDFLTHPALPGLRDQLLAAAEGEFGMDENSLADFLSPLNEKTVQMAAYLNVDLGANENYADVLANASQELVRLAMEASLESIRERETTNEVRREADEWRERATQLEEQTSRDALTGLNNRPFLVGALKKALGRARRCHTAVGLLFLDLDGFKPINDRFGHAAGDVVLKEVAAQLRQHVRMGDVVARFGGDEFCILLGETSEEGARLVGERVVRALNDMPLEFNGLKCRIGASVGAAVAVPWLTRIEADALMEEADQAMYSAKRGGKNRTVVAATISEADRAALAEVERLTMRAFLVDRRRIDPRKVADANDRRAPRPSMLRMARRLGWLDRPQAVAVARRLRADGMSFEEAMAEIEPMPTGQIQKLIACRQDPPEFLVRRLVRLGCLSEGDAKLELTAYYDALGARRTSRPRGEGRLQPA